MRRCVGGTRGAFVAAFALAIGRPRALALALVHAFRRRSACSFFLFSNASFSEMERTGPYMALAFTERSRFVFSVNIRKQKASGKKDFSGGVFGLFSWVFLGLVGV